jgi:hypothetical protein
MTQIPREKRNALEAAVETLKTVSNVVALVLGGSYARGVANESSDIDIGVYYRESAPLAIKEIRAAAESMSTPGATPVVTDLYGWGPWVNGGAWIQTPATKIDLVYRNLDQVEKVIAEGKRGIWRHDYDQQPPFGFRGVVYFAETHYCVPLHDPEGEMAGLKSSVAIYPDPLKDTILREGLWGAEFSLWSCAQFAASTDVYNTAGCLTRAAQYIVHALFALNGQYFLNDKHANRFLNEFPQVPPDFNGRLAAILANPGSNISELRNSVNALSNLWSETVTLTQGAYQPRFDLTAAQTAK